MILRYYKEIEIMKKLILFTGIVSLFLSGCQIYPDADFSASRTRVQPYEDVHFTNYSNDAISYEWDFGDGYITYDINPTHSYEEEGLYTVTLTAESRHGRIDRAYLDIDVVYTLLEITVAEWNEAEIIQFIVPGALVILYETLDDWYYDLNAVVYGTTDGEGIITFAGLNPRRYYVYVEANNIPNPGDRYDNLDFYNYYPEEYLATHVLIPYELNTFLAWADYFPADKNALPSRRNKYDLNKIKRNDRSFIIVDVSK
jgi:hypothetical protein